MKFAGTPLTSSILLGLTVGTTAARAAGFSDDFESYAVGSSLHGQGGWKGWDNNPAGTAFVSSAVALGGTRSLAIAGSSDLVHEFSGVNSGVWTLSLDQFVPSGATGESFIILLNKYRDGGVADYDRWSSQVGMFPAAGQVKSDPDGDGFGPVLPMRKDAWATWAFTLDLPNNQVWEYYDGQLLDVRTWQVGGDTALAALDLFANDATAIFYDNLRLSQVPEPRAAFLFGLGALLFALRPKQS